MTVFFINLLSANPSMSYLHSCVHSNVAAVNTEDLSRKTVTVWQRRRYKRHFHTKSLAWANIFTFAWREDVSLRVVRAWQAAENRPGRPDLLGRSRVALHCVLWKCKDWLAWKRYAHCIMANFSVWTHFAHRCTQNIFSEVASTEVLSTVFMNNFLKGGLSSSEREITRGEKRTRRDLKIKFSDKAKTFHALKSLKANQ